MRFWLILLLLLSNGIGVVRAQHVLRVLVRDSRSQSPVPGATVALPALHLGAATDATGTALVPDVPAGSQQVKISSLGYESRSLSISLPQAGGSPLVVLLEAGGELLADVVVEATRSNSRIEDIPLRVEVIGAEEVEEEIAIRPADISKLLTEMAGIQPQFTSASSGSVAFRIQGLDGRYTQILKDGFPLYGGFAQGLSLVQIPPLDLRQVEVVKGASSALYGGDAIAGLINLVSKTPTDPPALNVLLNQTHKGGRDLSAFYTGRTGRLGLTLLATQNTQQARDVSGDGFTDLPQVTTANVNPRVYYYATDSTTLYAGLTATLDSRDGGYLPALDNPATGGYTERNRSERYSTQLRLDSHLGRGRVLTLKNSLSAYTRRLTAGSLGFSGQQFSTYSEASLLVPHGPHRTVLGLNGLSDTFQETNLAPGHPGRDYAYQTGGLFVQDDWKINQITLQLGLRADYQRPYGLFVLPRLAILYKPTAAVSLRAGGGYGYKAPTLFSAVTEQRAYAGVQPLNVNALQAETARGLNADITLKTQLDEVSIIFNQAVFYTQLHHTLFADSTGLAPGLIALHNAGSPVVTQGLETNLRVRIDELQLFGAYTFTDARQTYDPGQPAALPFVARHRVVLTGVIEEEQDYRLALEASYNSAQYLGQGTRQGPGFWILGALAAKSFGPHFSLVLNLENYLDVRQTRLEQVVSGPVDAPTFQPLYAPLDGFVGNVALKITL